MKNIYYLLFFNCIIPVWAHAQSDSLSNKPDSLNQVSIQIIKDSVLVNDSLIILSDSILKRDSLNKHLNDSLATLVKKNNLPEKESHTGAVKLFSGKEDIFYFLVFLLLFFGFLRLAFAKYFYDMFRVFFRTTLKQKQVRELLLQSQLASVLMNFFFVLSTSFYINLLLLHFKLSLSDNFWIQYVYCASTLAFIYIVKFLGLRITGWLFNVNEAADSYTFIVFIICKMLGIMLLPFIVLLAFTTGSLYNNSLLLSWIAIGLLLGYRFILSYSATRNEIKLNPFHFIIYIVAFEIIPVLLIYKLLLVVF